MLRKAALLFAVVLLAMGVLGFVPALAPLSDMGMPMLFGIFIVGLIHNFIHLASGAAALLASKSESGASLYFKVFGVIYAVVTVVGFIQGNTVLGLIDVNLADNILHMGVAVVALGFGFGVKPQEA